MRYHKPGRIRDVAGSGLSNVPLSSSVTCTVDGLLYVTIVVSACGATAALMGFVAGNRSDFLGMKNE